jgi:hypothetical protein
MSEQLIQAVPELADAYEEYRREWAPEEPGPHNVYSEIPVPSVATLIREGGHEEILTRVFNFLESLAITTDEDALNVLSVTVIQELVGLHPEVIPGARRFLGTKVRKAVDDYEAWLAHTTSGPE